MMRSIEATGKSVDAAIFNGLQQLGISIDEVNIEILQMETKGILGIGAKPAKVRLTEKPAEEVIVPDFEAERVRERRERQERRRDGNGGNDRRRNEGRDRRDKNDNRDKGDNRDKNDSRDYIDNSSKGESSTADAAVDRCGRNDGRDARRNRDENRTNENYERRNNAEKRSEERRKNAQRGEVRDASSTASVKPEVKADASAHPTAPINPIDMAQASSKPMETVKAVDSIEPDNAKTENSMEQQGGNTSAESRQNRERGNRRDYTKEREVEQPSPAPEINYTEEDTIDNPAADFVNGLIEKMGIEAKVLAAKEEGAVRLRIDSETMGVLIGHRGETLDAIQYLTSLVINRNRKTDGYTRVTINTEDYREKREETLIRLAKRVGAQVKATGRARVLEPMNPYERRILHSALQNNPHVATHSEGEEPNRRVVVTPKRRYNRRSNEAN